MDLLPREQVSQANPLGELALMKQDKLLIATLGQLAQKRLARGLRLNRPEAVALIAFQLHEFIRDGNHSVADLMDLGKKFLGRRHVVGKWIWYWIWFNC
jgi:urease gamma subunit